jgi:hypothetical protein
LLSAIHFLFFFVQWRDAGEPSSPYVGLDQAIWAATHPSVIQVLGEFLAKASPADLTFEDEVKVRPSNIGDSSYLGWFHTGCLWADTDITRIIDLPKLYRTHAGGATRQQISCGHVNCRWIGRQSPGL